MDKIHQGLTRKEFESYLSDTESTTEATTAVSYTHLDVYKRQVEVSIPPFSNTTATKSPFLLKMNIEIL